jgi:ABC-type glutathione transport system ATPase component
MKTKSKILSVNNLSCTIYKSETESFIKQFALAPISFDLLNYETIGLVGESGSGKTTLGRLITGALQSIDSIERRIVINGKIEYMTKHNYREPINRKKLNYPIQMIYQDPKVALNEFMRVRSQIEETAIIGYEKVQTELARDDWVLNEVNELLNILMLRDIENHYPFVMSGGQVRRLGIARVLAVQPQIIIADEPTASLDASTKNMVLDYLSKFTNQRKKRGLPMGTIIISHDLETISRYCDKVIVLEKGNLVEVLNRDSKHCFHPKENFTKKLWEDNAFFARV